MQCVSRSWFKNQSILNGVKMLNRVNTCGTRSKCKEWYFETPARAGFRGSVCVRHDSDLHGRILLSCFQRTLVVFVVQNDV